jgi:hypothetical protein
MTTTGEDTRPLPLIGQAVGQAQASLTRLLTGILAASGTSYLIWLGLQRLNAMGGQPSREAYEADLGYWLQLDRADLDTTIRILQEITRRAGETNTTEGNR